MDFAVEKSDMKNDTFVWQGRFTPGILIFVSHICKLITYHEAQSEIDHLTINFYAFDRAWKN